MLVDLCVGVGDSVWMDALGVELSQLCVSSCFNCFSCLHDLIARVKKLLDIHCEPFV